MKWSKNIKKYGIRKLLYGEVKQSEWRQGGKQYEQNSSLTASHILPHLCPLTSLDYVQVFEQSNKAQVVQSNHQVINKYVI